MVQRYLLYPGRVRRFHKEQQKVVSLGESVSSFSCRPFEPISDLLSLFFDYSLWNKQKSELTLIIDFHSEKQNITLGQS